MNKILAILILCIINIGLIALFLTTYYKDVGYFSPHRISNDSDILIHYYFDYKDFKLIYDETTNNILVRNKSNEDLSLLPVNGIADQYINNVLAGWGKLRMKDNFTELVPTQNCEYLFIEIKTNEKNEEKYNYTLSQVMTTWETCAKLPDKQLAFI